MNDVVLDASAIIAVYKREPGWENVAQIAGTARLSSLTLAEVATWLVLREMPREQVYDSLNQFRLTIEPFDHARAIAAGFLVASTKHRGLSLADRACLALAIELGLPVMTSDRVWRELDVGADIQLIR